MRTKVMSWLLALCLMVGLLPATTLAAAAPGTSSGTVIYVSESGDDSAAGDENAPLKTIGAAFTKAADGDTICLLSDIQLTGKLVLTGDKSVTLAGKAGETAKKITCQKASSSDNYMIEVGVEYGTATATNLTLENVTVDAEGQDIRCIRVCPESQLILENGATVCNGRAVHSDGSTGTNDWGGGIVVDSNAKLIMNDGSAVTGCSAEQGGGIYLSGEMELNGGTISGNTAVGDYYRPGITQSAHGGAILIRANRADYDESYAVPAKLTMTGGNIQNNKAASDLSAFGGAVAILGTPKNTVDLTNEFIMTGGTISGNTAGYGGAISVYAADRYWNGNASVKISGNAEITQNTGRNGGGAIALWTSKADNYTSTVEMSGGTISENETFSKGGGGEDPYGNLTVSKTVTGKAGDTEQKFTFTVKLDRAISGAYGDMTFNNGTAVVTLKHGESSTATKLPADIHYTVTESDNDGYTVTANGATGVISDGKTAVAAFINTKDSDAPDQPSNPDSPVTPNQPGSPDVPNDSGTPDDVPKMGDTMNLGLWISLMGLSLAGLFISLVVVKKRTRRNRHSN